MIDKRLKPLLAALLLAAFLLGAAAPLRAQVAPFQPGLRWLDGAELLTPWIPTSVGFAAGSELVWVGVKYGQPRLLLYAGPEIGVPAPVFLDTGVSGASGVLEVAVHGTAERLLVLAQYPSPDAFHRRTELSRYDALQAAAGAAFAPLWIHDAGFTANGPSRLAVDDAGELAVVVTWNDQNVTVRVDRVNADSGALLGRVDLPAATLETIALSGDGQRLALSVGTRLVVLDAAGTPLHDEALPSASIAVALDATGDRLLLGEVGRLRLFEWNGSSYAVVATHVGASSEIASKVGLSPAGESYAAAWWRFTAVDQLRLEVYDGATHSRVHHLVQPGQAGGLQNSPVALRISRDGRRTAFASWGKGDTDPEVVLFDLGLAQPLLEIDLPGSAMGLDLDAEGTRLAVITKNLHANQSGTTGEVRLYDTGERDLQLLAPARRGGSLHLASNSPGASTALFLIGSRAAVPIQLPGALGELFLDRSRRLYIFARQVDSSGRADLILPLPTTPALIGIELSAQVAARVQGRLVFGETVVDPLFY